MLIFIQDGRESIAKGRVKPKIMFKKATNLNLGRWC